MHSKGCKDSVFWFSSFLRHSYICIFSWIAKAWLDWSIFVFLGSCVPQSICPVLYHRFSRVASCPAFHFLPLFFCRLFSLFSPPWRFTCVLLTFPSSCIRVRRCITFPLYVSFPHSTILTWTRSCSAYRSSQSSYSCSEEQRGRNNQPSQRSFTDRHAPLLDMSYWLGSAAVQTNQIYHRDGLYISYLKVIQCVWTIKGEQIAFFI